MKYVCYAALSQRRGARNTFLFIHFLFYKTFSIKCLLLIISVALLISAERLAEDLNPAVPKMPTESASEVMAPKVT